MDRTTPNQQNKNCLVEILRRHVSSLEDRTYRTGMSFSGVNEREELLEMCYTSKFYNMKLRPSMSTWLTGVFKHIAEWRKFPASAVCRDGGIRLKPHQKAAWTTNVIKSLAVSRRNMGILDDEVHIKDSSDLGSLFRPACLHLTHLLRNSDVVFFVLRVPYPKEVQNIVLVLLDCRSRKFRLFDPKDLVCDRGRLQRRAYIKKTLKDLVSFVADAADEPRFVFGSDDIVIDSAPTGLGNRDLLAAGLRELFDPLHTNWTAPDLEELLVLAAYDRCLNQEERHYIEVDKTHFFEVAVLDLLRKLDDLIVKQCRPDSMMKILLKWALNSSTTEERDFARKNDDRRSSASSSSYLTPNAIKSGSLYGSHHSSTREGKKSERRQSKDAGLYARKPQNGSAHQRNQENAMERLTPDPDEFVVALATVPFQDLTEPVSPDPDDNGSRNFDASIWRLSRKGSTGIQSISSSTDAKSLVRHARKGNGKNDGGWDSESNRKPFEVSHHGSKAQKTLVAIERGTAVSKPRRPSRREDETRNAMLGASFDTKRMVPNRMFERRSLLEINQQSADELDTEDEVVDHYETPSGHSITAAAGCSNVFSIKKSATEVSLATHNGDVQGNRGDGDFNKLPSDPNHDLLTVPVNAQLRPPLLQDYGVAVQAPVVHDVKTILVPKQIRKPAFDSSHVKDLSIFSPCERNSYQFQTKKASEPAQLPTVRQSQKTSDKAVRSPGRQIRSSLIPMSPESPPLSLTGQIGPDANTDTENHVHQFVVSPARNHILSTQISDSTKTSVPTGNNSVDRSLSTSRKMGGTTTKTSKAQSQKDSLTNDSEQVPPPRDAAKEALRKDEISLSKVPASVFGSTSKSPPGQQPPTAVLKCRKRTGITSTDASPTGTAGSDCRVGPEEVSKPPAVGLSIFMEVSPISESISSLPFSAIGGAHRKTYDSKVSAKPISKSYEIVKPALDVQNGASTLASSETKGRMSSSFRDSLVDASDLGKDRVNCGPKETIDALCLKHMDAVKLPEASVALSGESFTPKQITAKPGGTTSLGLVAVSMAAPRPFSPPSALIVKSTPSVARTLVQLVSSSAISNSEYSTVSCTTGSSIFVPTAPQPSAVEAEANPVPVSILRTITAPSLASSAATVLPSNKSGLFQRDTPAEAMDVIENITSLARGSVCPEISAPTNKRPADRGSFAVLLGSHNVTGPTKKRRRTNSAISQPRAKYFCALCQNLGNDQHIICTSDYNGLKAHVREETGCFPYQCGKCALRFSNTLMLEAHAACMSVGEKHAPYKCSLCSSDQVDVFFVEQIEIRDHFRQNHPEQKVVSMDQLLATVKCYNEDEDFTKEKWNEYIKTVT